jgi:RNA polymerase sigma factor (TIGR02999 family)
MLLAGSKSPTLTPPQPSTTITISSRLGTFYSPYLPFPPMKPVEPGTAPSRVTRLLQAVASGQAGAIDELITVVYGQLRQISEAFLSGERRSQSLQPSDLVNKAYLRLAGDLKAGNLKGRAHFFHAAARAMERVLIEHARKRGRRKRGGDWRRVSLNAVRLAASEDPGEFLDLDEAIRRLDAWDPALGELVRFRFFAGLSVEEAADALAMSISTAKRSWRFARAWLYKTLREEERGRP